MDANFIYGPRAADLDEIKELKVKVSLRLHVKLHSLKLLAGKNMSGTVSEALEAYFARIESGSLRAAGEQMQSPFTAAP